MSSSSTCGSRVLILDYLERGDRQAAVRQVEKMLELKPASKRIRARLAELKP